MWRGTGKKPWKTPVLCQGTGRWPVRADSVTPEDGDTTQGQDRCHPTPRHSGSAASAPGGGVRVPPSGGPPGPFSLQGNGNALPAPTPIPNPIPGLVGSEGRVCRTKPVFFFLRQGALSWLGRGLRGCCTAYSQLPKSEGFREHQWDHSPPLF